MPGKRTVLFPSTPLFPQSRGDHLPISTSSRPAPSPPREGKGRAGREKRDLGSGEVPTSQRSGAVDERTPSTGRRRASRPGLGRSARVGGGGYMERTRGAAPHIFFFFYLALVQSL